MRNVSATQNVQTHLYKQLKEKIEHVADTLSNPSRKGYHKTLTTNVADIAEIAQKMNVGEDAMLNSLAETAKNTIGSHDVADLKADPALAAEVAEMADEQAAEISSKMSGLL